MLELLVKYARDSGLETEPGFKPKEVRWAVVCDAQGRFLDVIELGDTGSRRNSGQVFAKCPDLSQGELIGGSEIRSHFLVDTAEVVVFLGKIAPDSKLQAKHAFFIKLLREASRDMPGLAVLVQNLENPSVIEQVRSRLEIQKAKGTEKVSFKIGDLYVVESKAWHDWWRTFRTNLAAELRGSKGEQGSAATKARRGAKQEEVRQNLLRCFVSGELTDAVKTHPKIEGLTDVGGQGSGTTLIGYDKDSFCSYGFSQSANAAVSEEPASAYRAALNYLIKHHGQRLAGAKVVHWFKEKVLSGDDPMAWLEEGNDRQEMDAQQRAEELLRSIRNGSRPDLASNHYYAATLSGSGGRVMVRDWMEGQFDELTRNILSWFEDLAIVHREGGSLALSPKFMAVLGSTVRELDNLAPPVVARMWRSAVFNEMVPQSVLAQAVLRVRMGISTNETPNHARMGLIRAFWVRRERFMGGESMSADLKPFLNEAHPHPAYHCGRLMAVLAGLQRAALGDVGAGVVQRYYAAASSTPALVLGRLARTSQFHINKLDGGLAHWYEAKLSEVWGRIKDVVPTTLSLEEQSLFALGYYQQMADMRARKTEGSVQKEEESNE